MDYFDYRLTDDQIFLTGAKLKIQIAEADSIQTMLVSRQREKLLNALIYFCENVLYPGKTKLYKLLHYLDFLHYQETGRSVTGLDYYAWERGPVPVALHEELERPKPDFIEHLLKQAQSLKNDKTRQALRARKQFRSELFSPFELELIRMLAKRHFRHSADEMSEGSHFETGLWHQVWEVEQRKQGKIPYKYVLKRRGNKDDQGTLERAADIKAFEEQFS